jgi:hypothetical protein
MLCLETNPPIQYNSTLYFKTWHLRVSPPAVLIAVPIVFWGPVSKIGSHRRAPKSAGAFSNPIETLATPCRPLAAWRFSWLGTPCQREDATVRIGSDEWRLVVGVNGLPHGNRSGNEGGDWPRGAHPPSTYTFNACLPPPVKPNRRALLFFPVFQP